LKGFAFSCLSVICQFNVVTGESQVELFSDDEEEEEVVVAVGGRCSHTLVTGDALVFICRLAPSPFFDQQQDLADTTGKSPAALASASTSRQLIRPKDGLLPEGTPAKWQAGPGGCKEAGLSMKTVIRGEWKYCSVWEWIGW
jgi:hypothetical protein